MAGWQQIASGNGDNIPNPTLQSGVPHLVVIDLPVSIPDWAVGGLQEIISRFGVQVSIDAPAGRIEIAFTP